MTSPTRAAGVAVAAVVALAACTRTVAGDAQPAGAGAGGGTAVECPADAFTFTPPPGWTDVSVQLAATVVAYADTGTTGDFAANVNVVCEPDHGLVAEGYADANAGTEEKVFDATIEDRHEITLGGDPAVQWRLQHDYGSPLLIDLTQVLTVRGGKGWVISLSVAATDASAAPGYIDAIVASWSWT